jgi:hypothetical protein
VNKGMTDTLFDIADELEARGLIKAAELIRNATNSAIHKGREPPLLSQ